MVFPPGKKHDLIPKTYARGRTRTRSKEDELLEI
jgi:hypothetical protein